MFCTFTTKEGTLIIRTEDIRRLADQPQQDDKPPMCTLTWIEHDTIQWDGVLGTARENLDRLKAEEQAAVKAAHEFQQQFQQPPTQLPIPRGLDLASIKVPRGRR